MFRCLFIIPADEKVIDPAGLSLWRLVVRGIKARISYTYVIKSKEWLTYIISVIKLPLLESCPDPTDRKNYSFPVQKRQCSPADFFPFIIAGQYLFLERKAFEAS